MFRMQLPLVVFSAVTLAWVCGCSPGGKTCDQLISTRHREQDVEFFPFSPGLLSSLIKRISATEECEVYVPKSTMSLFFFEDLPRLCQEERVRARDLSDSCRRAYKPDELVFEAIKQRTQAKYYDPSAKSTAPDEIGCWLEISPLLWNPLTSEPGFFLRVAQQQSMPFGGERFWVRVSADHSLVLQLGRLPVDEF